MKYKYLVLLFLALISLVSSVILSFQSVPEICNQDEGCEVVQQSIYSKFLGIKNSHYGIFIFSLMSFFIFSQILEPKKYKRTIIHTSIIIGSAIAMLFIYLQTFVLSSFCKYCLFVDISLILSLILIIIKRE